MKSKSVHGIGFELWCVCRMVWWVKFRLNKVGQNVCHLQGHTVVNTSHPPLLIINPTRGSNFSNLFWNETLHVSDNSFVHHQEFFLLYTQVCRQLSSRIRMFHPDPARKLYDISWSGRSWSCSKAVYKPVWHTTLLCVQKKNSWWWTEELSETCRVSFRNKFEKLVHLVGFIIRICHDALPYERKQQAIVSKRDNLVTKD